MKEVKGRIHSIETFSTVDGPGIRSVIFLQGCPLRCQYCHNPDTWKVDAGEEKSATELVNYLERYRHYYDSSGGGITISGGEPCLQPAFTGALLEECKKRGLHVALDSSGWTTVSVLEDLLQWADLVLLDIKHMDTARHQQLTGQSNGAVLRSARLIAERSVPLWVRHVLVPGVTDREEDLLNLAAFLERLASLERLDILPYHRLGEHKWQQMGLLSKLLATPPSPEELARVKALFRQYSLPVA
jgi:pyruvate formate lyase activating enzyme